MVNLITLTLREPIRLPAIEKNSNVHVKQKAAPNAAISPVYIICSQSCQNRVQGNPALRSLQEES